MENTQATTAEGELVLHLYELRRETEMRKARNWFAAEFWPRSFADVEKTMMQLDSPQSHWFRQMLSYWDMAAALVEHGALDRTLFTNTSGEAWFCYAKMKPFVQECRSKFSPTFLSNLEKVVEGSPEGREHLQRTQEMIARMGAAGDERTKKPAA